jgi:hypothetical protein
MSAWDDRSHAGNYTNLVQPAGTPEPGDVRTAEILPKWHSKFTDSLEPGVRSLVLYLVHDLDLVTYTSCEGHKACVCSDWAERNVGIYPRSDDEREEVWELLTAARAGCTSSLLDPVRVDIRRSILREENKTSDVVDVYFRRNRIRPWNAYFENLDRAYQRFMNELRCVADRSGLHLP